MMNLREREGQLVNTSIVIKQHFFDDKDKKGYFFYTAEMAKDENIQPTHGRQNKHHGRQPGSYKRKRDKVRASRRRNRSTK